MSQPGLSLKRYKERLAAAADLPLKLLLGAAMLLWLARAFSPLWRDEAITYWVIDCGWREALRRALAFQEWSAAYFLLVKAFLALGGKSVFVLRLPSLAAAAVSVRAVYLLGKRLRNARAGLLSALVFAASGAASVFAGEARPYAPALAFVTLATLYLVKLLDGGKPRDMALYTLFAALAVYMQLLTAVFLAAHILYWACRRFLEKDAAGCFPAALAACAALLLPLTGPACGIFARRAELMFAPYPGILDLAYYLLPPPLLAGAAALYFSRPLLFGKEELKRLPLSTLALAAGLALLPPLLFFFGGYLLHAQIWVTRYFIYSQAGMALCAGILLSLVEPRKALRAAGFIAAAGALSYARFFHFNEDWRGAAAYAGREAARLGAPVMLTSPYVESTRPGWLTDPAKAGYLAAPLAYYPAGGSPVLLPVPSPAPDWNYISAAAAGASRGAAAVVLIGLGDGEYNEKMDRLFRELGFLPGGRRRSGRGPDVTVYRPMRRDGAAAGPRHRQPPR